VADFVQTDAAGAVITYEPQSRAQVDASGAAVTYDPQNQVQVGALGAVVVYSLEPDFGYVQVGAGGLLVVYTVALPPKRVFPVLHPKVRWQSQLGKRKFPEVA
jgi:hypothetical protein